MAASGNIAGTKKMNVAIWHIQLPAMYQCQVSHTPFPTDCAPLLEKKKRPEMGVERLSLLEVRSSVPSMLMCLLSLEFFVNCCLLLQLKWNFTMNSTFFLFRNHPLWQHYLDSSLSLLFFIFSKKSIIFRLSALGSDPVPSSHRLFCLFTSGISHQCSL